MATNRRRSLVGCASCGVPLEADATFCDQCGYRYLPLAATEVTSRLTHQLTVPPAPEDAAQVVPLAAIAGSVLALMLMGLLCYGTWRLAVWLWSCSPLAAVRA